MRCDILGNPLIGGFLFLASTDQVGSFSRGFDIASGQGVTRFDNPPLIVVDSTYWLTFGFGFFLFTVFRVHSVPLIRGGR